jgi:Thaumatin family
MAQADAGKLILEFPTLGGVSNPNGLSSAIYVYDCADSACSTSNQDATYGYVTNVEHWSKSQGGPGGPPPAVWVVLNRTGVDQYFQFWQQIASTSQWQNCIMHVTAAGSLGTDSTCVGINQQAGLSVAGAEPFWGVGALFSNRPTVPNGPSNPLTTNTVPTDSGVTFENSSSNSKVCLNLSINGSAGNPGTGCTTSTSSSLVQKIPNTASSNTYSLPNINNGVNGGRGAVWYVKNKNGWKQNWSYPAAQGSQDYSTVFEYTLWPYANNSTPGTWTFDISLVNGFNVGGNMIANKDMVCAIAQTEGGQPYFMLYKAGSTMASFPNTAKTISQQCPKGEQVSGTGCISLCALTGQADQCCPKSDGYNASNCTAPPSSTWVQDIDGNSTSVYSWAFEDYRGTFTCEAGANVTFQIVDAVAQPLK